VQGRLEPRAASSSAQELRLWVPNYLCHVQHPSPRRPKPESPMRLSLVVACALSAIGAVTAPHSQAADVASAGTLSRTSGAVTWTVTPTISDPIGCGRTGGEQGCERRRLVVNAPVGTWITVALPKAESNSVALDVTLDDGTEVVQGGDRITPSAGDQVGHAQVTWSQVRSGRVGYLVGVSTALAVAAPDTPVGTTRTDLHPRASLTGKGFDREPDCEQNVPDHVAPLPADVSRRVKLSVRILSSRADAAEVKQAMPTIVSTYRQIGIDVRLSYDILEVPSSVTVSSDLIAAERAHYRGVRPRGVDLVYFATDNFTGGGFSSCVGGIKYAERAFAIGGIHYRPAGGPVVVPYVKAGLIAAHELGHLMGAKHEFSVCGAAAEPGSATQGDVGPCTLMFPGAVGVSGTFSPLETAYIRDYATRFAKG
jgi:hypothetical protein